MAWQLKVIDGADKGRLFVLPYEGVTTLGSSRRHADICLNDLYVTRVHCEIETATDRIVVRALYPEHKVLLNGQPITETECQVGEVVRLGNTHLRLEPYQEGGGSAAADEEEGEEELDVEILEDDAEPQAVPAAEGKAAGQPAPAAVAPPPSPAKLPQLPLERLGELTGHRLAHYELGPVLGSGPASVTFRANDLKTGVVVALRVLSPQFPAKEAEMETFIKAVRVVMPLRHRNLITLWNAGRTGPYCWVAMDYVEGESLALVLEQLNPPGKFAWKHALRLGVHLARGLNFLACHRLAHGSVTPPHILIRNSDKTARLGDLLLGRALKDSALEQAIRDRKLRAEVAYQAPEQVAGSSKPDILCDIYSLGADMYARCVGRPPFVGRTMDETVQQIHEAPLVPLKQLQPAVPLAFDAVVRKMLARRREDRFRAPAEVLAELESLSESEGVEV
jgi:hypothetical protein